MDKFFQINNITVNTHFKDFLISNHNKVCRLIVCVESSSDVNFIAPSDKDDMISYLPKNKLVKVIQEKLDPFSPESGRARMKVGRLISKLYSKNILDEFKVTNADIEKFVNSYKSFFNLDNLEMRIVEGAEIKKWYYAKSYLPIETGTLWKSCMRHKEKQPFLNLYSKNPESVKMLILLQKDEDGNSYLRARALLWQEVKTDSSTIKVMDRIYSIYDSDVFVFKNWARENGYICKAHQNSRSHQIFEIDGQEVLLNCKIELNKFKIDYYPYLDTFQFFNISNGTLFNWPNFDTQYILNRANGSLIDDEEELEPEHEDDESYF